jgi:predicted Zn-dependent protease
MKEAARSVLGADRRLRVLYVVPRAPAAQAGLRRGDALVAIDGEDAGEGEPALKVFSAHSGSRLSLTVERDGEAMDLVLDGADACPYPVSLFTGDAINAFADGRSVGLTTGMLRFTESDAELALVVGHELAHNVLDHVSKQQTNVLAGTFLGALVDVAAAAAGVDTGGAGMDLGGRVGGGAFSREFESEADYLGAYLAVRAGYDISGAPQLWRRMAVEHPASISPRGYLATHPTTPERATGLERVVEEIAAKNRIGSPLVPERIEAARP